MGEHMFTADALGGPGGTERRESGRQIVNLWAQTPRSDRRPLVFNVRDMSAKGCMIDALDRIGVGGALDIQLPGLEPRLAKVIWANQQYMGCEFASQLTDLELDLVRASS